MHLIAGNPFAPDASSDWWNFAVNVFIGLATLAALLTSIRQSRRASAEATRAQELANDAIAREEAREAALRHDALVNRAARQATAVTAKALHSFNGAEHTLLVDVRNDSDGAIRDVEVTSTGADGRVLQWSVSRVAPNSSQRSNWSQVVEESEIDPAKASLTITLIDGYRDRWRITPDSKVELVGSAHVTERAS